MRIFIKKITARKGLLKADNAASWEARGINDDLLGTINQTGPNAYRVRVGGHDKPGRVFIAEASFLWAAKQIMTKEIRKQARETKSSQGPPPKYFGVLSAEVSFGAGKINVDGAAFKYSNVGGMRYTIEAKGFSGNFTAQNPRLAFFKAAEIAIAKHGVIEL